MAVLRFSAAAMAVTCAAPFVLAFATGAGVSLLCWCLLLAMFGGLGFMAFCFKQLAAEVSWVPILISVVLLTLVCVMLARFDLAWSPSVVLVVACGLMFAVTSGLKTHHCKWRRRRLTAAFWVCLLVWVESVVFAFGWRRS